MTRIATALPAALAFLAATRPAAAHLTGEHVHDAGHGGGVALVALALLLGAGILGRPLLRRAGRRSAHGPARRGRPG